MPASNDQSGRVDSTLRVVKRLGLRTHRTQIPRMAAALSYRTIFALIPMFVIGVAVIGTLADKDRVESVVDQVFSLTGIDRIVLDPGEVISGEDEAAESPDEDWRERARLDLWMDDLVSGVEGEQGRLKAIGAVGVAALVYAALGFLIEIERAFNSIYHARDGRAWARRFTNYTTILVVGPVFLILTFWMGTELSDALSRFASWTGLEMPILTEFIVRSVGVLISTLLFMLLYRVIPNARVHIGPAMTGAFIAAVLWELAKFGLVQYLQAFSGGVERLYGAIGLIPIFLLWVYVTWLIVLLGLHGAYLLQYRRDVLGAGSDQSWRVVDPAASITIAAETARRFARGRPINLAAAAKAAGIDEELARGLLEGLRHAAVVHAVVDDTGDSDEELYVLAGPPEGIDAVAVLRAGFNMTGNQGSRMLRDAQAKALEGLTLAELIADHPSV